MPKMRKSNSKTNKNLPARKPERRDPRYDLAFTYVCQGMGFVDAAVKAGFTTLTANHWAKYKLRDMLKQRASELLQDYKDQSLLSLNPIAQAERKLADILVDKPEELSKHAGILRQIKQSAGALAPDTAPGQTVVQIGELKALIQVAVPDLAAIPALPEPTEDEL